jgi:tetratricopeptide (TPR) repeat protein
MDPHSTPSLLIVPFNSHLPCSVPVCRYFKALLDRYALNTIQIVETGTASLSFVPDMPFLEQILDSANPQLRMRGQPPSDRLVGVFPKVQDSQLLLFILSFYASSTRVNQRVNFLRGDTGGDESLRSCLAMSFQQICQELHPTQRGAVDEFYRFVSGPSPELETAMVETGVTLAVSGLLSEARTCWTEVLRDVNPQSAAAAMNIGQSYSDEENYDEAEDWFTTALDLYSGPDSRALGYYNRGIARKGSGRVAEAISDFTEAVGRNPNLGMAYNNIGACYMDEGDRKNAELWFRRCCALKEDVSSAMGLGNAKELARSNLARLGG